MFGKPFIFSFSVLLIFFASTSISFGMDYTQIYRFNEPSITDITQDKQIVELEGTRQDDSRHWRPPVAGEDRLE